MKNKYFEWSVSCIETVGRKIIKIVLAVLVVFLLIVSFFIIPIALIVALIFGGVLYLVHYTSKKEYEYIFAVNELEIAKITNKSRRKKLYTCNIEEVEYLVKGIEDRNPTLPYYSRTDNGNVYTLVVNKSGNRKGIIMEPNEEFLQVLRDVRKLR